MAHVPGIIFVDGATGRRARVAGSGVDVFVVIGQHKTVGGNQALLQECFDLSQDQLGAAVRHYSTYPDEIDEWLEAQERDLAFLERYAPVIAEQSSTWRSLKTGESGLRFPSEPDGAQVIHQIGRHSPG